MVGDEPLERFNIVHAGVHWPEKLNVTDAVIDANPFADDEDWQVHMLQSRWSLDLPENPQDRPRFHPGLSLTYCGHTPMPRAFRAYSHYFLDTGAGHEAGGEIALRMTLIDHRADICYSNITDDPNDKKWISFMRKKFAGESNIHMQIGA